MENNDKIFDLMTNMNSVRERKKEVLKWIKKAELDLLKQEGFIDLEYNYPEICRQCNSAVIVEESDKDKIWIKCQNPNHNEIKLRDEYSVVVANIPKIITRLLASRIDNLKISKIENRGYFFTGIIEYKGNQFQVIFSLEKNLKENILFDILGDSILEKKPSILIIKDSDNNALSLENILLKMPLGNLVYSIYIEDFKGDMLLKDMKRWIDYTIILSSMEKEILDNIESESSKLITSIDTNPKYLLSALSRIRIKNIKKIKGDREWINFEKILSIIFRSIYSSDIRFGGHKQLWKDVPDNLFFVRSNNTNIIAGILDSKFSSSPDFSQEKTEKYINYFKLVGSHPSSPKKKALIFIALDTGSEYKIKEFFGRIESHLKEGEYCIMLSLQVVEILIHLYLGFILKGKINISTSDFNSIIERLFDKEYLSKNEDNIIQTNLYKINEEVLLQEIKEICGKESSIERAFEEIFTKK